MTRDEDCRYTSREWTPDGADIVASQDCSAIIRFGKTRKVFDRPWWRDLDPPADKTLPKGKL